MPYMKMSPTFNRGGHSSANFNLVKKGAYQEFEYVQWVFADYCSGGCVASFCGMFRLNPSQERNVNP